MGFYILVQRGTACSARSLLAVVPNVTATTQHDGKIVKFCYVLSDTVEFGHVRIIQKYCMFLVENLELDLSTLRDLEAIQDAEVVEIKQERSPNAQNYRLLKLLCRSKDRFDNFHKFLIMTGQTDIARIIRGQSQTQRHGSTTVYPKNHGFHHG